MRFLKVVTSGLAVLFSIVAGVVATGIIALAGLFIVAVAWLLGRRSSLAVRTRFGRPSAPRATPAPDVIDISATEVPAERLR